MSALANKSQENYNATMQEKLAYITKLENEVLTLNTDFINESHSH